MEDQYDQRQRRCPRLGGPVTFLYCRTCGDETMPCFKVLDCWWELFDVVAFFQKVLSHSPVMGLYPETDTTSSGVPISRSMICEVYPGGGLGIPTQLIPSFNSSFELGGVKENEMVFP